jgi:predicted nucleotidyltransferase
MVYGFNEQRPRRETYDSFVNEFSAGLEEINIEGLSLMLYGSYARGTHIIGRSDIDAVLIFADDCVINKKDLRKVSRELSMALTQYKIPFQVTPSDLTTMKEGRFNSYDETFREYFMNERKIILGPDYVPEFEYKSTPYPEQAKLNFNLRKARQGLLFSEYYKEKDYMTFLDKFNKSLEAIARSPKQLLQTLDQKLRIHKFTVTEELKEKFPGINLIQMEIIRDHQRNPELLDKLYKDPEQVTKIWEDSLTFLEELVKIYIKKY